MKKLSLPAMLTMMMCSVLLLPGCGGEPVESDEDFLESVRETADAVPSETYKSSTMLVAAGGPTPKIEVETNHYFMGEIDNKSVGRGSVKVYNRGDAPLSIKRVTTSCACTVGDVAEKLIQPGESTDLNVMVYPNKIPGFEATRVLTIDSNDPNVSAYPIMVTSYVKPEVEMDPEIVNFGLVQAGQWLERTFRLRQMEEEPLEVFSARATHHYIDVDYAEVPEEEWRTPGHREYDFTMRLKPDSPINRLDSKLELQTNLTRTSRLQYEVSGAVHINPYTFSPKAARFSHAKAGDRFENVYTIDAEGFINVKTIGGGGDAATLESRRIEGSNSLAFDLVINETDVHQSWSVSFEINGIPYHEQVSVKLGNPPPVLKGGGQEG